MTSSGPEPARSGTRVDLGRLRRADCGVAAGTLLYLVCLLVPWFHVGAVDLGFGYRIAPASANGFDSGLLVCALVLLVLATAWALLPAVADLATPFPRSFATAWLAGLAFLLTLIVWGSTFDVGFTVAGLLALLCSLAVLGCAALRLLPDATRPGALPRRLAGVVRWVNLPAGRRPASR
jgi:hypothetical protein